MTSFVCPHCEAFSTFSVVYREASRAHNGPQDSSHGAARCNNPDCKRVVGAFVDVSDNGAVIDWWPKQIGGKEFPDVPRHIAEAADEAYRCYSIVAYRAAALLARSVIEASAKDKGITRGQLVTKIDAMHKAELIRKVVKEGAHEVRLFGNNMAHGDFVEPVEPEEAEEVLDLMAEVLHDVYQQDARVNRRRAAREARNAGATE
jgi:hypothetical protein